MALAGKIRGLIKIWHRNNLDLAKYLGIERQSLQNKLRRNSFTAEDMIRIADFLGCELAYLKDGKTVMVFDLGDIPEKKRVARKSTEEENSEQKVE